MSRSKVDHREILQLLQEVDERGRRLSRWEIDFVADLIDTNTTEFTSAQAEKVKSIYDNRVSKGIYD